MLAYRTRGGKKRLGSSLQRGAHNIITIESPADAAGARFSTIAL